MYIHYSLFHAEKGNFAILKVCVSQTSFPTFWFTVIFLLRGALKLFTSTPYPFLSAIISIVKINLFVKLNRFKRPYKMFKYFNKDLSYSLSLKKKSKLINVKCDTVCC